MLCANSCCLPCPGAENGVSPALVVAALAPVLRWQPGRNPGDNDDTTRHLSGRSVRVLAFHLRRAYGKQVGLAFLPLASRMIRLRQATAGQATRERAAGEVSHSPRMRDRYRPTRQWLSAACGGLIGAFGGVQCVGGCNCQIAVFSFAPGRRSCGSVCRASGSFYGPAERIAGVRVCGW